MLQAVACDERNGAQVIKVDASILEIVQTCTNQKTGFLDTSDPCTIQTNASCRLQLDLVHQVMASKHLHPGTLPV